MKKPFSPLREDGRSRRRVVADLALALQPGELLSYAVLARELDTNDRRIIVAAVKAANEKLLWPLSRSLGVVVNEGYKLLPAKEHSRQANGFDKRGLKATKNARSVTEATDVRQLSDRERVMHEQERSNRSLLVRFQEDYEVEKQRRERLMRNLGKKGAG